MSGKLKLFVHSKRGSACTVSSKPHITFMSCMHTIKKPKTSCVSCCC